MTRLQRWFFFVLILVTPPLFLSLTSLLGNPAPGAVPAVLTTLFLIGWRMRLWVLRRLKPARARKGRAGSLKAPTARPVEKEETSKERQSVRRTPHVLLT